MWHIFDPLWATENTKNDNQNKQHRVIKWNDTSQTRSKIVYQYHVHVAGASKTKTFIDIVINLLLFNPWKVITTANCSRFCAHSDVWFVKHLIPRLQLVDHNNQTVGQMSNRSPHVGLIYYTNMILSLWYFSMITSLYASQILYYVVFQSCVSRANWTFWHSRYFPG